jgi:ABC-type bacteriocin/lantibiotic exporter with double-glycine peptidase domain
MLLIILSSLMFLIDPLVMKWLIDRVIPARDFRLLLLTAAGFFGLYVFRLAFAAVASLVTFRTVQKLVLTIRVSLLEQMNRLSADYHEVTPVGEKLYRIEQDVDQVAELGSSLVPYVLQTACNAVLVVGAMLVLDFRLTCMVLPLVPIFLAFSKRFESRLRQASDTVQQQSSQESSFLQEHLGSVVQIQLLHQEGSQIRLFLERAATRAKALNDRTLVEILFSSLYMVVIALGTVAILGYGGYQVFVGALTVGGLVAFYSYLGRLFDPLHAAVDIYSRLNRLNTSICRILEVLEMSPSVPVKVASVRLPSPIRGCIEMNAVSFCYRNGPRVLEGIDLRLRAGEKVALVGVSGSGKSTIAKLIARLYDPSQGAVCLDGIDLRDLDLENLRTQVCYVMQDTVLFDRTIRENLLLGNLFATTEQMWRAIEVADLGKLLDRLPNGWDTRIGPRGNMLSGGERQRLALARAVLQNPSLIVLDESTSALDVPSERKLFANLARHFRRQTMVLISHRVSALKWVDHIVVLNQGSIKEQGTHDQLWNARGLYTYLLNTSLSDPDRDAAFFANTNNR